MNYGRWVQPTLSGCFWCSAYLTNSVKELIGIRRFHPILFLDGNTLVPVANQKVVRNVVADVCADAAAARRFTERLHIVGQKYEA